MEQQATPPKRIAFARDRLIVGEVLLALLMAIFERHSRTLKRHFGSSLQTMAVGIAVLLSQLAEEPSSSRSWPKHCNSPGGRSSLRYRNSWTKAFW